MNIRQSVLGEIAVHRLSKVGSVDLGTLVRRLLLFDGVVVKSIRLRELPYLTRALGCGALCELLDSGILKFCCEFTVLAHDFHRNGVRSVPQNHFHFGVVDAHDREGTLRREFTALQGVSGLKNRERSRLEDTVWKSVIRPSKPGMLGVDVMAQLEADLRAGSPALRASVLTELRREQGANAPSDRNLVMKVEETQERVFHIRTNIPEVFGISAERVHPILDKAITAVANINRRLAEMQAYSAVTGFMEAEVPLLFAKLAGVVTRLNPAVPEGQFERIVEILGMPKFSSARKIDVDRIMLIRESAECRRFREWLSTLRDAGDSEIGAMVAALKDRASSLASSAEEAPIRFAATTGTGLLSEGLTATAVDSFVAGELLSQSGIIAFLTKTYPSLFVEA